MTDDELIVKLDLAGMRSGLTNAELNRVIELMRIGAAVQPSPDADGFVRGLEAAAKKSDEHAVILRGAEKRFTDMGELAMAEQARMRAEQVEIVALDIRSLSPAPTPVKPFTKKEALAAKGKSTFK